MEQAHEGGFYIKKDPINPDHYKNQTSLECIEAMQISFGREAVLHFCLCNAFKYIWRWENKNGEEDLDKASWYIDRAHDLISDPESSPSFKSYARTISEIFLYIQKKKKEMEKCDGEN